TEPAGGPGAGAGRTGSGIGLYVARRIVESHGGRIWLETAPGLGTEVTFTIPAAAPDPFRS
ncbi:MAG: hypothetical protein LBT54_00815, partial [Bifidobacteriaceae bacterium]|nr:hypothetical protein [Bifidobacteriaceae bacterium]